MGEMKEPPPPIAPNARPKRVVHYASLLPGRTRKGNVAGLFGFVAGLVQAFTVLHEWIWPGGGNEYAVAWAISGLSAFVFGILGFARTRSLPEIDVVWAKCGLMLSLIATCMGVYSLLI